MHLHRRRLCAFGLVLAALAISACGSSSSNSTSSSAGGKSSASASSPFHVVMINDITGPTKVYGVIDLASMKAAATYLNQNGGILGHKVTVTELNDNGDEATAASDLVSYLSSNPKPSLVFAGTSGIDSGGLIPLVKRDDLLDIAVDDGGGTCLKNASTLCPTAYVPAAEAPAQMGAAALWFQQHHYTNVGILEEEDAFSEGEAPYLEAALKADGISYKLASFSPTAVDVKPEISQLQSSGVQAIFAEALGAPAGYEGIDRAELGLVSKIPLLFDPGASSEDLTKLISAPDLKNAYETIFGVDNPSQTWVARPLVVKYAAPFGGVTDQPLNVAAYAWTDLMIVRDAAEQANSIDQSALVSALDNLSQKGQTDPQFLTARRIMFTPADHEDAAPGQEVSYSVVPVGPVVGGEVR